MPDGLFPPPPPVKLDPAVFLQRLLFQVVLGLYLIRGDNIVVIGEIDEDLDSRVDFQNVHAEPLMSIVRA